MAYLNVQVLDSDSSPVNGKKVSIFISHSFSPQTWLEEYTDSDGKAYFNFDGVSVDVYVNGECRISGTSPNGEVTVTL